MTEEAASDTGYGSGDAARALADIDAVVARVRRSRSYRMASSALILWGPIVAAGYVLTHVMPKRAALVWIGCHTLGVAATLWLARRERRDYGRPYDLRLVWATVIVAAFGLIWTVGLARLGPRELSAFWPTLFMMGYVLAGLWLGRLLVAIGCGITALTLAGYVFAGPWFDLYMAVVNGGGLLACGLAMRRS